MSLAISLCVGQLAAFHHRNRSRRYTTLLQHLRSNAIDALSDRGVDRVNRLGNQRNRCEYRKNGEKTSGRIHK